MERTFDREACGRRVRRLRMKNGMSQETLSELAGVDVKVISRFENGHREMRLGNFIMMSLALDVSVDYLIFGGDGGRTLSEQMRRIPQAKRELLEEGISLILRIF